MSDASETTPFGRLLRRRRTQRSVTQERLAYRADLSPRHVSFLETGRSDPSRESALALARALDLPLRQQNALLEAAGFAAVYPDRDPLASSDSRVRSLFGLLLERHEPFPAYVVDRAWAVRLHNRAGAELLAWLLGTGAPGGEPGGASELEGTNLLRALFDPERLRPLVVNFEAVGAYLLDRLDEEIALSPDSDVLAGLRRDLEAHGPLPEAAAGGPRPGSAADLPALPVHLRKDGVDLRLLSFLMTVAAPREVGLQELRLETFLPGDDPTEAFLRDRARD